MTAKNAYNFFKELPPWAKGVSAVAGIFAVYSIVKWGSKKLKKDDQKTVINAASNQVKNLAKQGIKISYPLAQYEVFAEALRDAFDGWGTTESTIYSVFEKMNNDADIYQLIETYGTRGYYGTLENFFGGLFGDKDVHRTLPAAISSELDGVEMAILNNILSKKKNITFRFT